MNVSGLGCRYCALLLTQFRLAISLVSIRMPENVGVHAFWLISGFMWCLRGNSKLLRMKTAWTSEGRYLFW